MNERPGNLTVSIDGCVEVELRAGPSMFPKVHSLKGERKIKKGVTHEGRGRIEV